MKKLFKLFFIFAKIGAITFGGGYAMLPILQREVINKNFWATEEELLDYYAIGQCTPGVIAVNTATFIGYRQKGILGAVAATLGVIFPSIIIITILVAFISNFSEFKTVQYAMNGIRICVCVLIADAVIKLWRKAIVDKCAVLIFALALLSALFVKSIPTALLVVIAGVLGYCIASVKEKKSQAKAKKEDKNK